MSYQKIKVPAGEKITADAAGRLQVPDQPIIGFIEGDGIGPDITAASMRIWNRAVEKAYGNRRKIAWMELFAGEKANKVYGAHFHSWNACVQNWGVQDGEHTIMSGEYSFFKPYYEMVLRMQEAGTCMDYGTIQGSGIGYTDVFARGQVAMLPMGSWLIQTMIQKNASGESSVNWGVAVVPHAEDVPNGYTVGATTPICINNASKNKDAAWRFVSFLSGPEGAQILAECGQVPALSGEGYLEAYAAADGMPEDILDGLYATRISPDRPAMDKVTEIDQMLLAEHQLILLGEETVDEGIANMNRNYAEIMGN